ARAGGHGRRSGRDEQARRHTPGLGTPHAHRLGPGGGGRDRGRGGWESLRRGVRRGGRSGARGTVGRQGHRGEDEQHRVDTDGGAARRRRGPVCPRRRLRAERGRADHRARRGGAAGRRRALTFVIYRAKAGYGSCRGSAPCFVSYAGESYATIDPSRARAVAAAAAFVSYLLFHRAFTSRLMELGCEDVVAHWPAIESFFARVERR